MSTRRIFVRKVHEHVGVITDEDDLTIEVLLARGPQHRDEHSMQFPNFAEYEKVEYEIMTWLRSNGFILQNG